MTDKPLWRQAYDAVDRTVTPRAEALVRTDEFADASALAARARSTLRNQVNGVSAWLWHLVNLPAGTDVQRLRLQVGALDREVRRLNLQLAQLADQADEEVTDHAATAEPGRRARPGSPRDRAQRPARP
jgi:hypothetical protein